MSMSNFETSMRNQGWLSNSFENPEYVKNTIWMNSAMAIYNANMPIFYIYG